MSQVEALASFFFSRPLISPPRFIPCWLLPDCPGRRNLRSQGARSLPGRPQRGWGYSGRAVNHLSGEGSGPLPGTRSAAPPSGRAASQPAPLTAAEPPTSSARKRLLQPRSAAGRHRAHRAAALVDRKVSAASASAAGCSKQFVPHKTSGAGCSHRFGCPQTSGVGWSECFAPPPMPPQPSGAAARSAWVSPDQLLPMRSVPDVTPTHRRPSLSGRKVHSRPFKMRFCLCFCSVETS